MSVFEGQQVIASARGAAMELAMQVARASQACSGDSAESVVGAIASTWYRELPCELQTILTMAADMAVCAQLIKSA